MNNYLDTLLTPLSEALAPLQPLSFISVLSIPFLLLFLTLLTLDGYHFVAFVTLGFLAGAAVVVTFILSGQLSGNDLVDKLRKRIGTHEDTSQKPNGSSFSLSPDGLGFSKVVYVFLLHLALRSFLFAIGLTLCCLNPTSPTRTLVPPAKPCSCAPPS